MSSDIVERKDIIKILDYYYILQKNEIKLNLNTMPDTKLFLELIIEDSERLMLTKIEKGLVLQMLTHYTETEILG